MLKSYQELLVWQRAMELVVLVYRLTETFPKREVYGLAAQLRRAGVSVPSNIAEGMAAVAVANRENAWQLNSFVESEG